MTQWKRLACVSVMTSRLSGCRPMVIGLSATGTFCGPESLWRERNGCSMVVILVKLWVRSNRLSGSADLHERPAIRVAIAYKMTLMATMVGSVMVVRAVGCCCDED